MNNQKIVIATNNLSKFKVIQPLLEYCGYSRYSFFQPNNLGIEFDVTEVGSLQNRARLKAIKLYETIKAQDKMKDVYMIIGSDDGIRINNEKKTYSDSKMATDRILSNDKVKIGDSITIVRAFAFVSQKGNIYSCITRVPMTFIGNLKGIKRLEGVYPLEQVLTYRGSNTPISDLDIDSSNSFNQKYMAQVIKKRLTNFA